MNEYRLSDEVIAQIAKIIQVAILTGTDVVDNLRMMRVTNSSDEESVLGLTDEYKEISENQIADLLEKASQASESTMSDALEIEGDLN